MEFVSRQMSSWASSSPSRFGALFPGELVLDYLDQGGGNPVSHELVALGFGVNAVADHARGKAGWEEQSTTAIEEGSLALAPFPDWAEESRVMQRRHTDPGLSAGLTQDRGIQARQS